MNLLYYFSLFIKKASITFFAFLFVCSVIRSQPNHINFENFTIENGLSNNLIHFIFQDKKGWMWFGTYQGLNRFDGYKFTTFDHNPSDSASLETTLIRNLFEDNEGRLWVGTEKKGIYIFNRDKENFERYSGNKGDFNLRDQTVNMIRQDRNGYLWLGTDNGLCQLDRSGKIIRLFQHSDDTSSVISNKVKVIFIDRADKLWIGTTTGVDLLDLKTNKINHLSRLTPDLSDEICAIFCNTDSKIWLGTYKNGITIIDPLTFKSEHLIIDPSNERSNTVRAIVKDQNGYYWIGTRGGLYLYSKENHSFSYFNHDERERNSLVHNSVLNIYQDAKGDFWIGTRGGISYIVKERQFFKCFHALPNDNHYLNNSEIYTFWMDPSGKLWIGTETGGVNIYDPEKGTFSYIKRGSQNGISNNCVKALMGDRKGNVWVGTFMGGIDIIDYKTRHALHFKNQPNDKSSLSDNRVWSIYMDSRDHIWIGTEVGLDRFEPSTRSFVHYKNIVWNQPVIWIKEDSGHDLWVGTNDELAIYNPTSEEISHFRVNTRMMHEDLSGRFWVTTLDKGLALFDKHKGIVKTFDKTKGIADNQTYCILEDKEGYFWISTINGLSRFDPKKETFRNFDRSNGLQNNQFRYGACFKTPNDELIFGGITGFNIFNPAEIKTNEYEPPVVFTDFRIFNKHVPISTGKNSILPQSISETHKIVLPYNKNVITIEFAALNYAQSIKNKYEYKLNGFESDWNEAGYQRSATYTNLDPGEYTFFVRASNNDNVWNKNELSLIIKVLPPYWKTWWFKLLSISLFLTFLYGIFIFITNRNHLKHELMYEKERTQMLHELDMMKVSFFTNISHELRTPLTLITSPLEKIIHTNMPVDEIRTYAVMMNRNAKNLLRLVNQLLDFRKIETGNLKLELSKGDIVFFIKEIVSSFSALAQEKNIRIGFHSGEKEIFTHFDEDKVEKIINNLLSNSIKYTPNGGTVGIKLNVKSADSYEDKSKNLENQYVVISVEDTGIGISEPDQHKIFDRFFQIGKDKSSTGTGIGLALTKELVKLHNGRIYVESKVNKGSKFTVYLPLILNNGIAEESYDENIAFKQNELESKGSNEEEQVSQKILLIVDDNADIRFFLRSNFERDFKVLEATDGKEGLHMAFQFIPDIIISDVLMPLIDGKEFCKRLKKDERTSHIPIVLLTALSSKSHKMEGIIAGADDYVSKPFDIALLRTKVENLLELRNLLREKYSKEMILKPQNIIIDSPDAKFLRKVIDSIEQNLTDSDFDIDKLSMEVGVSRTQLYRKLTVLTNMSARDFIRNIRLKRAAQLLEQNKMNISDIAYAVGFKDLSHFRKCFHQEFGMNATEYTILNSTRKD
ncbi:MAG TPA: two-component regulator propeller domain-containing protein [Bacteroidales bacterium]